MNYSVEFIFLANISGPMALHLFALAYCHTVGFLGGSMGEDKKYILFKKLYIKYIYIKFLKNKKHNFYILFYNFL